MTVLGIFGHCSSLAYYLGPKISGSQRNTDSASSNPIETSQLAAQFSDGHLHFGALDSLMTSF